MLRKSTNDLSIKPKMSRNTVMVLFVAGIFVLFSIVYFAYTYGVQSGHDRFQQDQANIEQLNTTIDALRGDLSISEEGLIFSKRQLQIQEEAYKQMSKAYSNSEQKNSVLGSRLDFYRSIISPEDGESGPSIQDLKHSFEQDKLTFDVTLVQAIKHKHQVRGNLRVTLFENNSVAAQWPLSSTRSVSYQYFNKVSGSFDRVSLADDAKIKVEFSLQGGDTLERWFSIGLNSDSTNNNN